MGEKGQKVMRHKLEGAKWIESYPECAKKFKKSGWFCLYEKIQGFNKEVVEAFADRFDGCRIELGSLIFQVTGESIVVASSVCTHGERWFKNKVSM